MWRSEWQVQHGRHSNWNYCTMDKYLNRPIYSLRGQGLHPTLTLHGRMFYFVLQNLPILSVWTLLMVGPTFVPSGSNIARVRVDLYSLQPILPWDLHPLPSPPCDLHPRPLQLKDLRLLLLHFQLEPPLQDLRLDFQKYGLRSNTMAFLTQPLLRWVVAILGGMESMLNPRRTVCVTRVTKVSVTLVGGTRMSIWSIDFPSPRVLLETTRFGFVLPPVETERPLGLSCPLHRMVWSWPPRNPSLSLPMGCNRSTTLCGHQRSPWRKYSTTYGSIRPLEVLTCVRLRSWNPKPNTSSYASLPVRDKGTNWWALYPLYNRIFRVWYCETKKKKIE